VQGADCLKGGIEHQDISVVKSGKTVGKRLPSSSEQLMAREESAAEGRVLDEVFELSDDDENTIKVQAQDDNRVTRLQQENAALLLDLERLKLERDHMAARKTTYKSRLLEREAYIRALEGQLKHSRMGPWQEILNLAEKRLADIENVNSQSQNPA
jgi:hypothetical protein